MMKAARVAGTSPNHAPTVASSVLHHDIAGRQGHLGAIAGRTLTRWRSPRMISQSRHSAVGSQAPLAGSVRARARNGVRAILTPAAKKTVSKSELYFESRSWIRTLIGIFSSHATFRAWLCHPGRVGMCGGVAEDDTARADVQEDEHVQDTQADAVDGQEVARPEPRGRERGETATKSGRCAVAPGPVDNGEGSCGSSSSRPYSRA